MAKKISDITKQIRKRTVVSVAAGVIVLVACYTATTRISTIGIAGSGTVINSINSSAPEYSDAEVLQYLLFLSGKITKEHPKLAFMKQEYSKDTEKRYEELSANVSTCLKSLDSDYHQVVTLGFQSGDPYRTELALSRIKSDSQKWQYIGNVTPPCPAPPPPPPPPSPPQEPDYLQVKGWLEVAFFEGAVVSTTAVVSMEAFLLADAAVGLYFAAVVAAVWTIVFTYAHASSLSKIDSDKAIAEIASRFRSDKLSKSNAPSI